MAYERPSSTVTAMKLFFSTEPAPCPYLPDRRERRLVTMLDGADPDALHEQLMQAGFRRSQGLAYRPACPGCTLGGSLSVVTCSSSSTTQVTFELSTPYSSASIPRVQMPVETE